MHASLFPATNLTAGTLYEVAVWAHTSIGDSPTALSHHQTSGIQPERPLLKARALNQTAVDCSWTISGPPAEVKHTVQHTSSLPLAHVCPRWIMFPQIPHFVSTAEY